MQHAGTPQSRLMRPTACPDRDGARDTLRAGWSPAGPAWATSMS